ncbi:MAG: ABC transporter permease subunit, partial [Candidatus Omnitrophica bacterium]|nr:ABC transporter permease subunit [Candidatus Omnitrophota bacterium]
MLSNIQVIAGATVKEALRSKVFYVSIAVCAVLVYIAVVMKGLAVGNEMAIMIDAGLSAIQIIGVIMAAYLGSTLISKEMESRTIQVLMAKPMKREDFVLGKFIGGSLVIWLNLFLMGLVLLVFLVAHAEQFRFGIFRSVITICVETSIILGVAMFVSTFISGIVSALTAFMIFAFGHVSQMLPPA